MSNFQQFKVDSRIIENLKKQRIITPTKIQEEVVPKIINGEDVIGQSKTGTGKTLAFLIPLVHIFIQNKEPVLIMAPTKELCNQIYDELKKIIESIDIKVHLLVPGSKLAKHHEDLKSGYDFVIGVPGRVLKLASDGSLKLSLFKKLVLDEADFLIDLGFHKELEQLFVMGKNINQVMMFSATLSAKTKKVVNLMHNQKYAVRVDSKNTLPDSIKNYFIPIEDADREKTLFNLMQCIQPFLCIIFVRTKDEAKSLFPILKKKKISVISLHGDLSPSQRKIVLKDLNKSKYQYLVATDLASRGLDLPAVTHIINYSQPLNQIDYVHRAGRTGRMHDDGEVYNLCNTLDEGYLKKYIYYLEIKLDAIRIKGKSIIPYPEYKGVKARLNLKDISKKKTINKSKREAVKNDKKKRRNRRKK